MSIISLINIVEGSGLAQQFGNFDWRNPEYCLDVLDVKLVSSNAQVPMRGFAVLTMTSGGAKQTIAILQIIRCPGGTTMFVNPVRARGIQVTRDAPMTFQIGVLDENLNALSTRCTASCIVQLGFAS